MNIDFKDPMFIVTTGYSSNNPKVDVKLIYEDSYAKIELPTIEALPIDKYTDVTDYFKVRTDILKDYIAVTCLHQYHIIKKQNKYTGDIAKTFKALLQYIDEEVTDSIPLRYLVNSFSPDVIEAFTMLPEGKVIYTTDTKPNNIPIVQFVPNLELKEIK